MNRFEIRDILQQHKEHFRVLPTGAMNALHGIITAIDDEGKQVKLSELQIKTIKELPVIKQPVAKPVKKESPAKSFTTGKVAKKKAKKKSR